MVKSASRIGRNASDEANSPVPHPDKLRSVSISSLGIIEKSYEPTEATSISIMRG